MERDIPAQPTMPQRGWGIRVPCGIGMHGKNTAAVVVREAVAR